MGCAHTSQAPTTQVHRGQEMVYAFRDEMTLRAAEAIKMALDEEAARMANRTYHVHLHTGDTWHYAFRGEDGMESIAPLLECETQANEVSALAKVAEEWVRETGRAERGDVDDGGHSTREVPQGRMDDTGGHNGGIPRGNEGAGGSTVEGAGSPHPPS